MFNQNIQSIITLYYDSYTYLPKMYFDIMYIDKII